VNVNAVVSGQAGVALLVNGMELSSIHAGRSGQIVRRSPAEAHYLLGDAGDLQFLEDIEFDEVVRRLELASAQMDAFHTALILLDGSLPTETRQIAAEELQEFLADETLVQFVESVLFAHPLTPDSDLPGAVSICTAQTERTLGFLLRLASLQEAITEVHQAWERIATPVFGNEENRRTACSVAVREGLFRYLVLQRAAHASVDQFLVSALLRSEISHHDKILPAWVAPLRDEDYPVYESEEQFVAESAGRYPEQAESEAPGVFLAKLSLREQEIVRLLGRGMSNKQIAIHLGCAEGTIRQHLRNILSKLGNKGEASAWALSHNSTVKPSH
jgi:DNA-binding NarL/FixJ family response regulator